MLLDAKEKDIWKTKNWNPTTVFIVTYRHIWFDKFQVTETVGEGKYIYFI
jgi:hypothetical protein